MKRDLSQPLPLGGLILFYIACFDNRNGSILCWINIFQIYAVWFVCTLNVPFITDLYVSFADSMKGMLQIGQNWFWAELALPLITKYFNVVLVPLELFVN